MIGIYTISPFYREISELLFPLYDKPSNFLSEINLSFVLTICNYLNLKTEIINSKSFYLASDKNERLIDAYVKLNATNFIFVQGAKDFLNLLTFENKGLAIEWIDYSNYLKYKQKTKKFVFDLLINDCITSRNFFKIL